MRNWKDQGVAVPILRCAAIATIMTTSASASPGGSVASTVYVTADLSDIVDFNHDRVKLQTKEPTTVRVQRLDFAAGGYTGFHHHPGVVIVAVQSGILTLVDGHSCATEDKPAGSVFVEGEDHVHQAISRDGATAFVTYVVPRDYAPSSEKYRIDDPAPFCASTFESLSKKPR
jgi:quercetin dioxygenase-like cupin family protein